MTAWVHPTPRPPPAPPPHPPPPPHFQSPWAPAAVTLELASCRMVSISMVSYGSLPAGYAAHQGPLTVYGTCSEKGLHEDIPRQCADRVTAIAWPCRAQCCALHAHCIHSAYTCTLYAHCVHTVYTLYTDSRHNDAFDLPDVQHSYVHDHMQPI